VRLGFEPVREAIPIWSGALLERSLELTGEVFDGWIPGLMPFEHIAWAMQYIDTGLARAGRSRRDITIAPTTSVIVTDEPAASGGLDSRPVGGERFGIAMYYGNPTSPYAVAARHVGFDAAVDAIQEAYASGGARAAAGAVPVDLVRSVAIVGTAEECRHQIAERRAGGVDLIGVSLPAPTRAACEPILAGLLG
jgi:alkanesulfonate monooxygenase SsuD/methylene tetrahydromethanopterin reductase-like flavin-dependent oxidoreductase (luciferase family)